MFHLNTKQVLVTGFGSIFVLMLMIVGIATDQMSLTFKSVDHIVRNDNAKMSLISEMLVSARERTISLQKMVRMEDAFERDDEWMLLNGHGADFLTARKRYIELGISEEEQSILSVQGRLTNEVVPVQRKIAKLAFNDELAAAEKLLYETAIPGQDLVFVQLYHLLNFLETESNQTVHNVSEHLEDTKQNLWTTIVVIMLACTLIAIVIYRRINIAEKKLSREKERAQVTLHSIGDAVISTDAKGFIKFMNSVAEDLTGVILTQVINKKITKAFTIYSDYQQKQLINPVLDVILNRTTHSSDGHARLIRDSGKEYAIEYTASPIFDSQQLLVGAVLVFRDVTEMRAMALQLGFQASHDELTGLINRREFENRIELALISARGEQLVHAMCYLDLDQFKVVNDTCGHIAGDELLRQLASLLKAEIRSGDTLARLGGDEFGVLYLNCSLDKAVELAEKLRTVVNDFQFNWKDKSFTVGVSIGLVAVDEHSNLHTLLSTADSACYLAKDEGRNRVHCFNDNDEALAERKGQMQWVHVITRALEDERFEIFCQKMMNFDPAQATHFELLIRMRDEDGQLIPPLAFIPAAERYNLMGWVDRWMIQNAFMSINKLLNNNHQRKLLFAINISAQSLCDDDFLPYVVKQFEVCQLDPALICFEVTETSAIVNLTRAQKFMKTLKALGCSFSLDDFGSGLSSFSYLKNLDVDFLKIDGAFVRDIVDDPIDRALVESINQVGHVMGIKTIAEYVETKAILEQCREIGVDFVQGYEVARPVPINEIEI
ncbi:MAG: EAL domain-containing protein [Gammaproteobacteria bacterium]|nr:EAL domain-containing protein [Gammaproteobacteria bacterium]